MSISGGIVSEIVARLCLENSLQTLLNFFASTPNDDDDDDDGEGEGEGDGDGEG